MVGVERILQLLAYLAALVGCLPVVPYLQWWVQLGLLLAFGVGIVGDKRRQYLLKSLSATLLSFALFGLFMVQVSRSNLVEPLIHMLCLLLAVRLATEKSPRNILQLFLLATIILAASSLLTLNMAYLVYLVLLIVLVTFGLVLLTFFVSAPGLRLGRREWSLLLKVMLLLPAGSLLLMLALFVMLPRTQTPLWNFLNPKPTASIGMTDEVRPGSVSELAGSGRTAFRVEARKLPITDLYWRGVVLGRLDDRVWKRSSQLPAEELRLEPDSEVQLTFFTEPKSDRYLVTLDRPHKIENIRHHLAADGVATGRWNSGRKLSYQVSSQLTARSLLQGSASAYLELPDKLSGRVREIGEQIGRQGGSVRQRIARLEAFFLQQQLSYSNRQLPITENPVETFLFETKRGYCEYFASSFAMLLRLAGVPARLVGGYLGGDYNGVGNYYLVGEDLAHVWVEALDDEGYWQRIDPSRLAVNAEQALLGIRRKDLPRLQVFGDAMLHYWSRLVLNYDLRQQFGLIRQAGQQLRGLGHLPATSFKVLLWGLPLVCLAVGSYFWRRHRQRDLGLLAAYRRQVAVCAGRKELPAQLGLFELARQSEETLCQRFAEIYGAAIYRDQPLQATDFRLLRQIIRDLRGRELSIEVEKRSRVGDNNPSSET